jgi:ElaB/YqjD/DUF883 family membrane-anchored ribosome-binding protein
MSDATQRIEREIEQTRQDLGDTAEALAAKTDVKARAHDKVEDVKASAQEKVQAAKAAAQEKAEDAKAAATQRAGAARGSVQSNPVPVAAIAAVVGVALIAVWAVRHRA